MAASGEYALQSVPVVPRAKPLSLTQAIDGSEREVLVALRENIAAEIDAGVPAHVLAPLSRQLRDLDKEIRSLDVLLDREAVIHASGSDTSWNEEAI